MQNVKSDQKISTLFLFLTFLAFVFFAFLFLNKKEITEEERMSRTASYHDEEEIVRYLEKEVIDTSFEGKVFADFYEFGSREQEVFIWAYISEYYMDNGEIKQGSFLSDPIVVILSPKNKPIGYRQAGSGEQYRSVILRIFPEKYHKEILNFTSDNKDVIDRLKKSTEEKYRDLF